MTQVPPNASITHSASLPNLLDEHRYSNVTVPGGPTVKNQGIEPTTSRFSPGDAAEPKATPDVNHSELPTTERGVIQLSTCANCFDNLKFGVATRQCLAKTCLAKNCLAKMSKSMSSQEVRVVREPRIGGTSSGPVTSPHEDLKKLSDTDRAFLDPHRADLLSLRGSSGSHPRVSIVPGAALVRGGANIRPEVSTYSGHDTPDTDTSAIGSSRSRKVRESIHNPEDGVPQASPGAYRVSDNSDSPASEASNVLGITGHDILKIAEEMKTLSKTQEQTEHSGIQSVSSSGNDPTIEPMSAENQSCPLAPSRIDPTLSNLESKSRGRTLSRASKAKFSPLPVHITHTINGNESTVNLATPESEEHQPPVPEFDSKGQATNLMPAQQALRHRITSKVMAAQNWFNVKKSVVSEPLEVATPLVAPDTPVDD
ncbi:hypothetical protein DAPPUDRAFT_339198 [Daphnia pulex]|uniref:Uncharacterized protein n=1 Tax=Daphnia pulex TaxID=6669 RepID=E9I3C3_DAPPU|nr:hypothetical protein DAPPUDRAFT_339198 [Daphnia pulex]|eukprot:EFX61507.1 hypothetical protein DAPPUDRAFT_339198 [Daphnia pulex]